MRVARSRGVFLPHGPWKASVAALTAASTSFLSAKKKKKKKKKDLLVHISH
jgi:hypothetical protein